METIKQMVHQASILSDAEELNKLGNINYALPVSFKRSKQLKAIGVYCAILNNFELKLILGNRK